MDTGALRDAAHAIYAAMSGDGDPTGRASREAAHTLGTAGLVDLIGEAQAVINTLSAVQAVAMAHVAAFDVVEHEDGTDDEQHYGIGHQRLDAPALIASRLGCSDQVATARVTTAIEQATRTPNAIIAMACGAVDVFKARIVTDELSDASPAVAAAVVAALGDPTQTPSAWGLTPGPLRRRCRDLLTRIDPDVIAARVAHAHTHRGLHRTTDDTALDRCEGFYPPETSRIAWAAVDIEARRLLQSGDADTLSHARADAHMNLLLAQVTATVIIHTTRPAAPATTTADVPTTADALGIRATDTQADLTSSATCAEATDLTDPASMRPSATRATDCPVRDVPDADGMGIPAVTRLTTFGAPGTTTVRASWLAHAEQAGPANDTSQQVNHDREGQWAPTLRLTAAARSIRTITGPDLTCHPLTGALTGGDVPTGLSPHARTTSAGDAIEVCAHDGYRIPAPMARLVRLRDNHCRFPGCTIHTRFCDLDHARPWPTGPTHPINLLALCRRHHRIKQRPGWTVRLDPDGTATWTDPTGHAQITHPTNHLDSTATTPTTATSASPTPATSATPPALPYTDLTHPPPPPPHPPTPPPHP
ncbi:MAG: hypothetical protein KBB39_16825, partial [Phycicoccus sp.]|nr:hypothetical protein [Phycicoccus sp.]